MQWKEMNWSKMKWNERTWNELKWMIHERKEINTGKPCSTICPPLATPTITGGKKTGLGATSDVLEAKGRLSSCLWKAENGWLEDGISSGDGLCWKAEHVLMFLFSSKMSLFLLFFCCCFLGKFFAILLVILLNMYWRIHSANWVSQCGKWIIVNRLFLAPVGGEQRK